MKRRFPTWWGLIWRLLVAAAAVMLLMHPELQGIAPILNLLGSLGLDGALLLVELQCAVWLAPVFNQWVVPCLTRLWNRHGAPRLGMPPSDNVLMDASLSAFHAFLCRGGQAGLALYLVYIALSYHFTVTAGHPLA